MIWSFCFAGVPGFVAAATMASVVQDIDTQIVQSTAAFPWIDLAVDSVGKDLALGILCPQIVVAFAMAVSVMAPASRQALAFSEDGGLVFPKSLCRIRIIGGTAQPVNAMLLSLPVCMVAACLNLAGSEVFNSIIGLLLGAVNLTLIISIGSVLWRRTLGPEQSLYGGCRLPPAPWSLGRLGVFINAISVLYLGFITVISYFPVFSQVTPNGMNWGVGMFMGAMLVSLAAYMFWGRRKYTSPATKLRREGPTIHAASAAVE